jgi:hypothetical protein
MMSDTKRARLVHGVAAVALAGAAACAHGLPPLRIDRADRAAAAPRLTRLAVLAAAGEGATAAPADAEGMTLAAAFQLALAHSEQVAIAARGVIEAQILARDRGRRCTRTRARLHPPR